MFRHTPTFHQHRALEIETDAAVEPVTVFDLKIHQRLSGADEDEYLEMLIKEARTWIEEYSGLSLITQTWKLWLDNWPGYDTEWWDGARVGSVNELEGNRARPIILPRYPVQSVDGMNVYDEDDNASAVTVSSVFFADTKSKPGRLALRFGQTWPVADRLTNAIEITFTTGYGDNASDVPPVLTRAVKQLAGFNYEHRGECEPEQALRKSGAFSMLRTYMVRGV